MREAIGGTWLFGLVITFIVFFASFLAVSVNYSRAFNVKNNIVDLISKNEGNSCHTRLEIAEYLKDVGYLVPGKCSSSSIGYKLNGDSLGKGAQKAYYCIEKEITGVSTSIEKNYYSVEIFFRIDLPVVGELFTFKIKGESEYIYYPFDQEYYDCGL